MSHCTISWSPLASHWASHQLHSWARARGLHWNPKAKFTQAMGDFKRQLGDCARPPQKQRKSARKHIYCLVAFPAPVVEHHCWCARGGWCTKGHPKALRDLCLQPSTGFTGWHLKITIAFKRSQQKVTRTRLSSCASCEPEVVVQHCYCHSQPEHTWEDCLILNGTECLLEVWTSASRTSAGTAGEA